MGYTCGEESLPRGKTLGNRVGEKALRSLWYGDNVLGARRYMLTEWDDPCSGDAHLQIGTDMDASNSSMREWLRNLPNKLTLFRMAIIPLMCLLYPWDLQFLHVFCAFLFSIGAISDFLDGYLARKLDNVTKIGEVLDPISDKLLVAAALVLLTDAGVLSGWITVVVLSREMAISGLRLAAAEQGISIKVSSFGKIKTALQDVGIALLLTRFPDYHTSGMVVLWVSILFSYYSAYQYWNKYWEQSRNDFI